MRYETLTKVLRYAKMHQFIVSVYLFRKNGSQPVLRWIQPYLHVSFLQIC